jgi:hypothetical protein
MTSFQMPTDAMELPSASAPADAMELPPAGAPADTVELPPAGAPADAEKQPDGAPTEVEESPDGAPAESEDQPTSTLTGAAEQPDGASAETAKQPTGDHDDLSECARGLKRNRDIFSPTQPDRAREGAILLSSRLRFLPDLKQMSTYDIYALIDAGNAVVATRTIGASHLETLATLDRQYQHQRDALIGSARRGHMPPLLPYQQTFIVPAGQVRQRPPDYEHPPQQRPYEPARQLYFEPARQLELALSCGPRRRVPPHWASRQRLRAVYPDQYK